MDGSKPNGWSQETFLSGATKAELFEKALDKILRPLARAMIALGVPLNQTVSILKRVLVEEAATFSVDGKPLTDSRISVLTGVHRKDVKALREADSDAQSRTRNSVLSTVIARWLADPAFRSEGGLVLPRLGEDGAASFNALVESVASDVRPRTVLDALITQGVVKFDVDSDAVELIGDAYVPSNDEAETLRFFENNLHDHLAAATSNILNDGEERFLERAVFYSNLSADAVASLKADVEKQAMDALLDINAKALDHQKTSKDASEPKEKSHRFRFGVFFYSEDESDRS